jgi:hypothetical protein
MRTKRLLIVALAFVMACKPPAPAEQMDSILSWIGTAGMVGDTWLRHTTPDTYTRQTLERSHKTLEQIAKDLLESPPLGPDSDSLNAVLTRSRRRIARMGALITAKNAPGFARELDSLRAEQRIVKQLSDRIESKK